MKKTFFALACICSLGVYSVAADNLESAKSSQDAGYGSALSAIETNISALKAGKILADVPVISEKSLSESDVAEKGFGPGHPGQPGGPGHQQPGQPQHPGGPGYQPQPQPVHPGPNPGQQPYFPSQPQPGYNPGYQPQQPMGPQDLGTCNGSDSGWEEHWLGHSGKTPEEACRRCREKHGSCNYTCSKPMYVCTSVFQPQQPNGGAPREYNGYASADYYNAQRSATNNCTQSNWGVPGQCSIKGCNTQNFTTAQGRCN